MFGSAGIDEEEKKKKAMREEQQQSKKKKRGRKRKENIVKFQVNILYLKKYIENIHFSSH